MPRHLRRPLDLNRPPWTVEPPRTRLGSNFQLIRKILPRPLPGQFGVGLWCWSIRNIKLPAVPAGPTRLFCAHAIPTTGDMLTFFALGDECIAAPDAVSMRELLLKFAPHNYSVARTLPIACAGGHLQLSRSDLHVERLRYGLDWSRDDTRRALIASLEAAFAHIRSSVPGQLPSHMELVILLLVVQSSHEARDHLSTPRHKILAYPRPASSHCRLDARWHEIPRIKVAVVTGSGQLREDPLCKHSSWIRCRKSLEELKAKLAVDEIIMTGPSNDRAQHSVLEGLVNNIFIVHDSGIIQTAPSNSNSGEGVLPGISRQLVLEVCREAGMRVLEQAPLVPNGRPGESVNHWKEAFVTNVTNLVVPVREIVFLTSTEAETLVQEQERLPGVDLQKTVLGPSHSTRRIRELVSLRIRKE